MKRKLLIGVLSAVMVLCNINTARASETDENADMGALQENSQLEFVEISDECMQPADFSKPESNVMDRPYIGKHYMLSDGISMYSADGNEVPNTDPNYAYIVNNDTITQGAIESAGELRWYAFVLNEKSKVSILVQMENSLDADLYMFSLDSGTSKLELIGGSASEGKGVPEYYSEMMEPGTYFFAIGGYEGTGNFVFANYQSSKDVNNEPNDTVETAAEAAFDNVISGVIDNPNDIDYYKITVTKPSIIQYSISSPDNYSMLYAGSSSAAASMYMVNESAGTYQVTPGSYYFAVLSQSGSYSLDSTYTLNFHYVGAMLSNSLLTNVGISEEAGIVYQSNALGTMNYVNGNRVDINYSYNKKLNNSEGYQSYNISIDGNALAWAKQSGVNAPAAVYYLYSSRPAMDVDSQSALMLTFLGDTNFYKIDCYGTKAYKMNTFKEDLNFVTVLIDPATGKLIDIAEFNYFYDYAPVGSNSITYTRMYHMDFYTK